MANRKKFTKPTKTNKQDKWKNPFFVAAQPYVYRPAIQPKEKEIGEKGIIISYPPHSKKYVLNKGEILNKSKARNRRRNLRNRIRRLNYAPNYATIF